MSYPIETKEDVLNILAQISLELEKKQQWTLHKKVEAVRAVIIEDYETIYKEMMDE